MSDDCLVVRHECRDGHGDRVRVTTDTGRDLFEGAMPPLLDGPGPWGEWLPGVNIDVFWNISHAVLGSVRWEQRFRDGQEVVSAASRSAAALDIDIPYAAMLAVCYERLPFEAVLDRATLLGGVTIVSCLIGLLHHRSAPRPGTLGDDTLDALTSWSAGRVVNGPVP